MFTNSEIIKSILKSKGLNVHKVYVAMNNSGEVYRAFNENHFTPRFIEKLEKIVGEDLKVFINSNKRK